MADYSSSDAQFLSETTGNFTANITLEAGVTVAVCLVGGFEFAGDTYTATLDGNSPDVSLSHSDYVRMFMWADPTTGSDIELSVTGLDAGDYSPVALFGVTSADSAEIADTGSPDTATSAAEDPSVDLTTATDDLCVDASSVWDTTSGADRITEGAGQTEIYEDWVGGGINTRASFTYEKATGASTTMSQDYATTLGSYSYGAFVIPTAEAIAISPYYANYYSRVVLG